MNQTPPDKKNTSNNKSILKGLIAASIDLGIAASRDPVNAGLPDLALRLTTIYSPWYALYCPECRFKFREGDRVRLCPLCGQAFHDDEQYRLGCWAKHFAQGNLCKKGRYDPFSETREQGCRFSWNGFFPGDDNNVRDKEHTERLAGVASLFLKGLERIWTPFGDAAVHEVRAGDSMIGLVCPWCDFLIRAGDHVVRCPCGKCDTYFHDDIFRHMTCWNSWNGSKGHDFCPTTGEKIVRPEAGDETNE